MRPDYIAIAFLAIASCGGKKNKRAPAEAKPHDAAVAASKDAGATSPIAADARQLVVGVTDSWESPKITLTRFARASAAEPWQRVGESWPATVGKSGLGWGVGLHGNGRPIDGAGAGPVKREGDGRAAAGVFRIGDAYGYSKNPPGGTGLAYTQATDSWRCVDDISSTRYNQILDSRGVARDWKSAELMRRKDHLYEWVINIEHNTVSAPRAGSCIFFHVWRGPGRPTVGCTAMPKPAIEDLLTWLEPSRKPIYVALPKDRYEALRSRWLLPPL